MMAGRGWFFGCETAVAANGHRPPTNKVASDCWRPFWMVQLCTQASYFGCSGNQPAAELFPFYPLVAG